MKYYINEKDFETYASADDWAKKNGLVICKTEVSGAGFRLRVRDAAVRAI